MGRGEPTPGKPEPGGKQTPGVLGEGPSAGDQSGPDPFEPGNQRRPGRA
jgi:hypothetical protein